ncbi:MAG: hypothetical protein A2Z93_14945 [Curvibacter sp. GWA2_64_110]|nr:MAG: hypothetical protein A2Z93_14945 [Curvibacter sp. GWA2_64_110]HCY16658.1 hypothetical protein [Curvibacter sp.]
MLKCKEITHLLSEAQDRELSVTEKLPLRMHLLMCQGCRNFKKQMAFLREASRSYTSDRKDTEK